MSGSEKRGDLTFFSSFELSFIPWLISISWIALSDSLWFFIGDFLFLNCVTEVSLGTRFFEELL